NILQMQHLAGAGGWTRRYQYETGPGGTPASNRLVVTSLPGDPTGGPSRPGGDALAEGQVLPGAEAESEEEEDGQRSEAGYGGRQGAGQAEGLEDGEEGPQQQRQHDALAEGGGEVALAVAAQGQARGDEGGGDGGEREGEPPVQLLAVAEVL